LVLSQSPAHAKEIRLVCDWKGHMGTSKYCHYPCCLEKPHAHPLHVQIRLMTDIHDLKAG
jgi:hypothetical protein